MAIAGSSVAADQSASVVTEIGQTIERRLIHTFHLVERIIPRFRGSTDFSLVRDGSSRLLPEAGPAIALSLQTRSAMVTVGLGATQQFHATAWRRCDIVDILCTLKSC